MNELKTQKTPTTLMDENDVASHLCISVEEARALLSLTNKAYSCNDIYYIDTVDIPVETLNDVLIKEAQSYVKCIKLREFIDDHQGCTRYAIQKYLKSIGETGHFTTTELLITTLTEMDLEIYEDDNERLYSK